MAFVLYISASSEASRIALRNLKRTLAHYDEADVSLTVCDLLSRPHDGDDDRIAFTPTLVRRWPEPRTWILGDLRDAAVITDMLEMCGVRPTR